MKEKARKIIKDYHLTSRFVASLAGYSIRTGNYYMKNNTNKEISFNIENAILAWYEIMMLKREKLMENKGYRE